MVQDKPSEPFDLRRPGWSSGLDIKKASIRSCWLLTFFSARSITVFKPYCAERHGIPYLFYEVFGFDAENLGDWFGPTNAFGI